MVELQKWKKIFQQKKQNDLINKSELFSIQTILIDNASNDLYDWFIKTYEFKHNLNNNELEVSYYFSFDNSNNQYLTTKKLTVNKMLQIINNIEYIENNQHIINNMNWDKIKHF